MTKSRKLPAMPFYFGDWRRDPGIRALTFEERGVWFEILGLLWESEERGKLILNGKKVENDVLARQIGIDQVLLEQILSKIFYFGIALLDPDSGCLINRRMIRDEEIRQIRKKNGRKGGKASVNKRVFEKDFAQAKFKQTPKQNAENEYENEEGSFSNVSIQEKNKKDDVQEIFEHWQKIHNHPRAQMNKTLKNLIKARLAEKYTKQRIIEAIENIRYSRHHMGENDKGTVHDGLDLICRSGANIDRFADMKPPKTNGNATRGDLERYNRAMI